MILITGGHAQGLREYAQKEYDMGNRACIEDMNARVAEYVRNGKDPWPKIEQYISQNPDAVIISEQIGCGIVPADAQERAIREKIGRMQIRLAETADEVVRVICGIGQKIK